MLSGFNICYLGEPVLEDYWNFQPSSEFTLDSDFINSATSTQYGFNHDQKGKYEYYFED